MVRALQHGKVIIGIPDPVHFPDPEGLPDDLDAPSLGASGGRDVDMVDIAEGADPVSVVPVDLLHGSGGALYVLCRQGDAVDIAVLQILEGIQMLFHLRSLPEGIDRVIGLDHGLHGRNKAAVDLLHDLQGKALAEEDIFLAVQDQGSAGQDVKIRPHVGADHIPHAHKRPARADPEEAAPLLVIDDPENIRGPHGLLFPPEIEGIVEITCHCAPRGAVVCFPVHQYFLSLIHSSSHNPRVFTRGIGAKDAQAGPECVCGSRARRASSLSGQFSAGQFSQ